MVHHPTAAWDTPGHTTTPADLNPAGSRCQTSARHEFRNLRTKVSNGAYASKLALCTALTAGGAALSLHPAALWRAAGTVLLGCMFAHAAELQHEALHNLGFRSRRANAVAGLILGMPMLISFSAYRAAHLRHHRDLGTSRNREYFDYGDRGGAGAPGKVAAAAAWAGRFAMIRHYRAFARDAARAVAGRDYPGETANTSRRIRRDHLVITAALAAVLIGSLLTGRDALLWLWLAPLVLVAGPVHAAIELPEHFRCEALDQDPYANTRTIRSNRLMSWFTNGNNFHVEHHLAPNLPIAQLPRLHQEVRGRLRHFHPGYVDFARSLVFPRAGRDV